MISKSASSYTHRVWIAGDYHDAVRACREFTEAGLCVAVQPADYVYTYGMETGVCVTLINYPRFPAPQREMQDKAVALGKHLMDRLSQGSFSVEGPNETFWFSRREADL